MLKQRVHGQELGAIFDALEAAIQATPWALTENFVATREGRGRLALTGPGDPTGRGLGFSYFRDDRKVSKKCFLFPLSRLGSHLSLGHKGIITAGWRLVIA